MHELRCLLTNRAGDTRVGVPDRNDSHPGEEVYVATSGRVVEVLPLSTNEINRGSFIGVHQGGLVHERLL